MDAPQVADLYVGWPKISTTVRDALFGLPKVRPDWQREDQSWRKVKELPASEFYRRISSTVPANVGDPVALTRYDNGRETSGKYHLQGFPILYPTGKRSREILFSSVRL